MRWSEHWYWRPIQLVVALVGLAGLHIVIFAYWLGCKIFGEEEWDE